mgnify:CR=1 FL=1
MFVNAMTFVQIIRFQKISTQHWFQVHGEIPQKLSLSGLRVSERNIFVLQMLN